VSMPRTTAAPAPCAPKSLNKEIKKADVVFRGMVDKAKPVRGKGDARTQKFADEVVDFFDRGLTRAGCHVHVKVSR